MIILIYNIPYNLISFVNEVIMNTDELYVTIGGIKQNILITYTDINKPILLILHGGPGSPDRPLVNKYNNDLAEDFVIVCWDQRCSGLSFTKESKKTPLTPELMLSDLKELVEFLLNKYNKEKLYIAGHSWGAYLGLWFASKYPDYLYYYIGTGQGISSTLDEIEKYNFVLSQAKKRNDEKVIQRLISYGAPQSGIYPNDHNSASNYVGKIIHKYGGYIHPNNDFSTNKYFSLYLNFYGLNILKVIGGINYSVKYLTPQVKENDVISGIKKLEVPILLIFGENDYICPVQTAKSWFDELVAPKKELIVIKNASHMVNFEQPERWNKAVRNCLNKPQ